MMRPSKAMNSIVPHIVVISSCFGCGWKKGCGKESVAEEGWCSRIV